MADFFHNLQLHDLSIEQFLRPSSWRFFSIERLLKTKLNESLPDILDGLGTTGKCFRNLSIGPCRAVRISLEQNLSPANLLAGPLELANPIVFGTRFDFGDAIDLIVLARHLRCWLKVLIHCQFCSEMRNGQEKRTD